jgi:4,5-dihydroxyphthalate decarboxylase
MLRDGQADAARGAGHDGNSRFGAHVAHIHTTTGRCKLRAMTALRALLGNHSVTRALREGDIASPMARLDFADVATPNKAFKRVVREGEFDVAELALMTFLMARSRSVPLRLFPVVLFSRNPLPYLICRAASPLRPQDLEGRRIGVRAYTTTTAMWVRALLADQFGVDSDRIEWLTFEDSHVADVPDPPNVRRDPMHTDLVAMLRDGVIDAAIVDPVPHGPAFVPVVPDASAAYDSWRQRTGAIAINHVMVVREALANNEDVMRTLFDLFRHSRERAAQAADLQSAPIGFPAIRRSLEVAIAVAQTQRLLAHSLAPDDLTTSEIASLR